MSKTSDLFNEIVANTPLEVKQRVDKMFAFANELDRTLDEHRVKEKGIVRKYLFDHNVFPIETEEQFQSACARIEELLPQCWEELPEDDPKNIELAVISNLFADWEDLHVVLDNLQPSNADIIREKFKDLTISKETEELIEGLALSKEEMNDERTRYMLVN